MPILYKRAMQFGASGIMGFISFIYEPLMYVFGAGSVLLFAWGVAGFLADKGVAFESGFLPWRRFIPIKEAATIVYERNRKTDLARIAESLRSTPNGILHTCAHALQETATLYGTKPPSRVLEPLPQDEMKSLWFTDDLTGLKHLGSMGSRVYDQVSVRRRGLRKALKEIKRWAEEQKQKS